MANNNMTIRFTPDGFSFAECPNTASILLDEAHFYEVTPGPDFQHQLQSQLLDLIPEQESLLDLTCQIVSTRVILLPSDVTDEETAKRMYNVTLSQANTEEQILQQKIELPNQQKITLCFGVNRELYLFLQRNYGEITFEHHLATLLTTGAILANGNCMVTRCDEQNLELALFRQGKLSLVNVYRTSQPENRAFYLMNTWQQEGLDQLQDNLLVLGSNTEALQVRANLHRFIKHVFS